MQLIPLEDQKAQVSSFSFVGIVALWNSLPDSKYWGQVDWVYGIRGRPSLAMLGASEKNGEEVYAVLDVFDHRVLSNEEFSQDDVEEHGIERISGGPELPVSRKEKRKRALRNAGADGG